MIEVSNESDTNTNPVISYRMRAYIVPATPLIDTSISAHKKIVAHLGPVQVVHVIGLYIACTARAGILSERADLGYVFDMPRVTIATHQRITGVGNSVCYNNVINGQFERI